MGLNSSVSTLIKKSNIPEIVDIYSAFDKITGLVEARWGDKLIENTEREFFIYLMKEKNGFPKIRIVRIDGIARPKRIKGLVGVYGTDIKFEDFYEDILCAKESM